MSQRKLILPVQRIDTERHCYVVRFQGDYYKVKQYPFQCELKKPETIKCINTTPNAYTPTLVQDLKTVIEDIYEDGVAYPFIVSNTQRGEDGTLNVELKDEYGFKHIYPDAGRKAVLQIGKNIELEIYHIEDDGSLTFCICDELEDKKDSAGSSISERDSINFDKLCEENLGAKKHLVDNPNFNGLWKSIIDKYPDKAHFIYELLQNADDAKATKASIILYRDGLIFKHNGSVPFSVTDPDDHTKVGHINSITGIGRSTKNDGISNTIGKFGVGFKAVYSYTNRPEIYDDKFWFAIEDYIVPVRLKEDHPMRKAKETLFYFPFKNINIAYDEILKKLRSLQNPSLFLNNINEIDWYNESGDHGHYSKVIRKQYSVKGIKCQQIALVNNTDNDDLWLFSRSVQITDHGKHNISVGYYLDNEGQIDTKCRHKVYCFFPTSEKVDLCFILHAPFLLTDNRQNVTDSPENSFMVEKLAELAAAALPILRDEGISSGTNLINDNIFDIGPLSESYWDESEAITKNVFFEAYKETIKKEALLLSRNGQFLKISGSVIPARREIVDIVDQIQLNELLKKRNQAKDFVCVDSCSDNNVKDYLSSELDIDSFGYSDLARLITSEFMQHQSKDWISKFYYSIFDNAKQLLKSKKQSEMSKWEQRIEPLFRKAPIFKNQNGEWIAPYKGEKLDTINIYKPSGVISARVNVVSSDLFELKNCQTLLSYLEIDEPNKFDQVKESLLKYEGKEIEVEDPQVLEDFETFFSFFRESSGEERISFVDKIRDYQFLVGRRYDDDGKLYKAANIYALTPVLEKYLKGDENKGELVLFDEVFYKPLIQKYGISPINDFLVSLGAKDFPDVEKVEISSYYFLNDEQKKIADQCSYSTRTRSFFDYQFPGLEVALEKKNISPEISKRIWSRIICHNVGSVLFTVKGFYYSEFQKHGDSRLLQDLKSAEWLYSISGGPLKPTDISINQMCEAGYEYNKEWFSYLGINPDKSDIMVLGATQEQQDIQDKGQIFKDCSYEEVQRAKFLLEQEKARERKTLQDNIQTEKKESQLPEPSRKKMEDNSLADMFAGETHIPEAPSAQLPKRTKDTSNKDIDAFAKKLEEEKESKLQLEELRQSVPDMEKYTMQWFSSLMRLELKATGEDDYQSSSSISISFAEVRKDPDSERIYILKNPSRLIPMELEEIGGLSVSFTFEDKDSFTKSFEVACVRNFSLLVKANQEDAASLSKIDWRACSKAEISINNISDLEKRLCSAFEQLGLTPEYNLKENLNPDISFVFGPPGTGKTTYLSKEITKILDVEDARILVLTPTNKACDVLTLKLLDQSEDNYSRVGRFVATAESEIEESGILKNRDSEFYKKQPCCLVSTIARLPYDGFSSVDGKGSLRNIDWDYVIIDEASMIPIAHITYAIYKFKSSKIIIAGDPLQIAPIAQESEWKDENIYTMTNLLTFDKPQTEPVQFDITYLDTQYRSVPEIGNLFSNYAYAGLLKNYRSSESRKELDIDGFDFGAINFMPFRVDRYDSLYGAKKLNNSNIHIYSALLVVEFAKYVSEKFHSKHSDATLSIGIICPYAPQAHLINNLLLQQKDIPETVKITVGTIHGFQGDECDVIISVFNPPTGLKGAANSVLINNRNIVNVAISRARDYLFIFMPSSETDGFDKLFELNLLGNIAKRKCADVKVFNSDTLETVIFKQRLYLERHSFVTSHQLANIYTEAQAKYEIRIDNSAIDVQIDDNL